MIHSRRALLSAIPALICAPAIVRASSLMPVRMFRDSIEVINEGAGYTSDPAQIYRVSVKAVITGHYIDDRTLFCTDFSLGTALLNPRIKDVTRITVIGDDGTITWQPPEPTAPSPLMQSTMEELARHVR